LIKKNNTSWGWVDKENNWEGECFFLKPRRRANRRRVARVCKLETLSEKIAGTKGRVLRVEKGAHG